MCPDRRALHLQKTLPYWLSHSRGDAKRGIAALPLPLERVSPKTQFARLAAGGRWIRTNGPGTEKLSSGPPFGFRAPLHQLGEELSGVGRNVRIRLPPAVSQANLRPHDARPPRVAAAQRRDPMTFLLVSSWQHPVAGTSRSRRRVHLILAPIQAPAGHHGPVVNTDVEYGSGGQSAIISGFQLSAMRRKPPLPKLLPRQIPTDG